MRTSDMRLRAAIAGLGLALAMAAAAPTVAARETFSSPEVAYEVGIVAYQSGQFDRAIPALEFAAGRNNFLAQFYLARIYADSTTAYWDESKAYILYRGLGDAYADIDPDDDQRAPFVAKALTALAAYMKRGVRDIGLDPDPERAADYLRHAATFFNDEDAQFELAKLYLNGDGVEKDPRKALHYLSVLTTERRHAGAQAVLADLFWKGGLVDRDPLKALALISVAVENAPASERVWIEDIYQNIFCGASEGVRHKAESMAPDWRVRYRRKVDEVYRPAIGAAEQRGTRTCGNDQPVVPIERSAMAPPVSAPAERPNPLQGSAAGFALKEAGMTTAATPSN